MLCNTKKASNYKEFRTIRLDVYKTFQETVRTAEYIQIKNHDIGKII